MTDAAHEHDAAGLPSEMIPPRIQEQGNSGRAVVLAMFAFAGLLVAFMFVYWHYHTALFRPFQDALAREFPGSKPRVEGGKHKLHVESLPRTLRVVMKIDYNPDETPDVAERQLDRIINLATESMDLAAYDELEAHFYQTPPEQEIRQWSFTRPIRVPAVPDASVDLPADGETR